MNKIALTITFLLISTVSNAIEIEIDGIRYNLMVNNDNVPFAEVTENRVVNSSKLISLYSGTITIPEKVFYEGIEFPVTKIGKKAFDDSPNLKSVIIPNSVTEIDYWAFHDCNNLISVTIPNSVTHIGWSVFFNCTNLKSVNIPNGLTEIPVGMFRGCSSLTSIIIPNGVKIIDGSAFDDCSSLTSVTIPNGVKEIGEFAFSDCRSLKSIILPNTLNYISNQAFKDCSSLKSITIPNSVTTLSNWVFLNCSSLTTVIIGKGMETIFFDAFENCSKLTDMYCYAEKIKVFNYPIKGSSISSATLHVPSDYLLYYKLNSPWSDFGNIVALTDNDPTPTGIKEVRKVEKNNEKTFDLNGRRIEQPNKEGIYIKNGKKVIVRDFKR